MEKSSAAFAIVSTLLESINSPADLRRLPATDLPRLADELRAYILETISRVGGHLSSNLGSVELTVALHYVFNTPDDRIVWDVGHQSYGHKILTGRRELLPTIRRRGGISGFPRRSESPFDSFGTAHSSTSISAALGMAVAAQTRGENRRAVAVIGDGAMSGGMAFEAMNNAGAMKDVNLLVVLNDNEMSISPAVGALRNYLARILSSRFYNTMRIGGSRMLGAIPPFQRFARRAHEHLKGMVLPGTMFEEFGFNYIGPIDGHDLSVLIKTLANLRESRGPQFLHVVTRKGKGFEKAEHDPVLYHGVGQFEPHRGIAAPEKVEKESIGKSPTYTQIFGDWLCETARKDSRLIAVTPAMREGSGLVKFSEEFPDRYFDAGIAEQHALTFSAGIACEGLRPVMAIYSTFLQRAYDQLIHDIALQNLPVMFAIDRAGIVGADGATHHGAFDLSYLRCIPNLTVMTPSNESEAWQMLNAAYELDSPSAVRYPRGKGPGAPIDKNGKLEIGKGIVRREGGGGGDVVIFAFGATVRPSMEAADMLEKESGIKAAVADMRFLKPLDESLILKFADSQLLVTAEENVVAGGGGSAVGEFLHRAGIVKPLLQLGLPDCFIDHGKPEELLAECGLAADGIAAAVAEKFSRLKKESVEPGGLEPPTF